jgi:hypothetical protein
VTGTESAPRGAPLVVVVSRKWDRTPQALVTGDRGQSESEIYSGHETAAMAERRIGVAMDFSASSKKALRWAADNLVRKGDTLVLLHVRHHGREEGKNALWSHTGSRKPRTRSPWRPIRVCPLMLLLMFIWIGLGGSTDPAGGAHGPAGEAALRHAG